MLEGMLVSYIGRVFSTFTKNTINSSKKVLIPYTNNHPTVYVRDNDLQKKENKYTDYILSQLERSDYLQGNKYLKLINRDSFYRNTELFISMDVNKIRDNKINLVDYIILGNYNFNRDKIDYLLGIIPYYKRSGWHGDTLYQIDNWSVVYYNNKLLRKQIKYDYYGKSLVKFYLKYAESKDCKKVIGRQIIEIMNEIPHNKINMNNYKILWEYINE